jgi:hypothetical protein
MGHEVIAFHGAANKGQVSFLCHTFHLDVLTLLLHI